MMVPRAEAERRIRDCAIEWMHETGYKPAVGYYPSIGSFRTWMEERGLTHLFKFRSQIDPRHEAEGWFEDEIRNYWRARGWPHTTPA